MEKPRGYKEIKDSFEFWTPQKKGEELSGKIVDVFCGEYGDQPIVETEKGQKLVTPLHAVLVRLLQDVKIGQYVIIRFNGEVPNKKEGRSPTKMYRVFQKE